MDFAELQAMNDRPMKMADWIIKLNDFLKLSEKKLLLNAGKVSAEQAATLADAEFMKYKREQDKNIVSDFDKVVKGYLKSKKSKKK